ncbi:MAG: NAD(+) synthase [Pirellulaceae bacterium]|nr:NAD(+) synthase [Pirellulaceae bacterium]
MKLLHVAVAALNQTPLDWEGNRENILTAIEKAKNEKASLLCLPELCISGYGCEDAFHSPHVQKTAQKFLLEIVPQTQGIIVTLGLPLFFRGALYNMVCLVADGEILGFVGKQNLAGDGLYYEPRWFKRWPAGVQSKIKLFGESYPIGDLIFECGDICIGFEICEDAWIANRPGGKLARQGVDLILNPSASHFAFGKKTVYEQLVVEGSRAFHVGYLFASLLGNESGRTIYDGGTLIASAGELLARGRRFSFEEVVITTATLDIDLIRMQRSQTGSFQPIVSKQPETTVTSDFDFPVENIRQEPAPQPTWETSACLKEEEFARAVALGMFDYMRKSYSRGFVLSLSGGADSTAVAALVDVMVKLALNELGLEKFRAVLGYIQELATANTAKEIVNVLLTTAYQATKNSSQTTRNAAKQIADAVGSTHYEFDVEEIVQGYTTIVGKALGRNLTWHQDDIALQNIQARSRAPSVWMLANINGALLVSTSNRSEAAVGYATMDGDTSGGLSPIAGIDKAFLRKWLVWLEKEGVDSLERLPDLGVVNCQQPTAELRPQDSGQTDESDLMPYEIIDSIERLAVRDRKSPLEIYHWMCRRFEQFSQDQMALWIERFFQLWCRNQWKRERYAPSFHLDDESLDPKSWCRFPILSGGYNHELEELHRYVSLQKSRSEKVSS